MDYALRYYNVCIICNSNSIQMDKLWFIVGSSWEKLWSLNQHPGADFRGVMGLDPPDTDL